MATNDGDVQPLLTVNNVQKQRRRRYICCGIVFLLTAMFMAGVTLLVYFFLEETQLPPTLPTTPQYDDNYNNNNNNSSSNNALNNTTPQTSYTTAPNKIKKILLWDQPTNAIDEFPSNIFNATITCAAAKQCIVSNARRTEPDADVIVFNDGIRKSSAVPYRVRKPATLYANTRNCLTSIEAADVEPLAAFATAAHFYNRTYTCRNQWRSKPFFRHRGGLTIALPTVYQWTQPQHEKQTFDDYLALTAKLSLRTNLAVLLRHRPCRADLRREQLIDDLRKYVVFNDFGNCQRTRFAESRNESSLLEVAQPPNEIDRFKFVLLMEDKISSNFYDVLRHWSIPVVFSNENVLRYAPPHSYIKVNDFRSMRALADYLKYLAANPVEYMKYFWWRSVYDIFDVDYQQLCTLCESA